MDFSDLKPGIFFTTNGKDIWRLESYFDGPSCTLENMDNKSQVETFGMNGHTARRFHRIEMPKIVQRKPGKVIYLDGPPPTGKPIGTGRFVV